MSIEMLEQVLDKIKSENPQAIIRPYGVSEPFLYKFLPEAITAAKRRGLGFQLSSNLNYVHRLEETLAAGPDFLLIGVSGWTQEIYQRAHQGGDIEKVKRNMYDVGQIRQRTGTTVLVSYHMYRDNYGSEMEAMREFCQNLGFQFCPAPARAISIENCIAFLRHKEKERTGSVPPIPIGEDGKDWNRMLPPVSKSYLENASRLFVSPERAVEFYAHWPISDICPIQHVGTYIRHDGKVTQCAALEDRRLDIGSFLDMTQEQLNAAKKNNPLCYECIRYRLNLYCCLVEQDKWQ